MLQEHAELLSKELPIRERLEGILSTGYLECFWNDYFNDVITSVSKDHKHVLYLEFVRKGGFYKYEDLMMFKCIECGHQIPKARGDIYNDYSA